MNARHLFRYARYALAALATVGFGFCLTQLSADLAATRPPHHRVTDRNCSRKDRPLCWRPRSPNCASLHPYSLACP